MSMHIILTVAVVLFAFLRLPSLFEPYWYRDEGIYQTIGMSIHHGSKLYLDVWDNKPPFLYFLYALIDGDQLLARFTSFIFGALSIIAIFLLSSSLYSKRVSIFVTTIVFSVLFALPRFDGNIANAENFMVLFNLLAYIWIVRVKPTAPSFFLAGIFLALSSLIKLTAVFDIIALLCFSYVLLYRKTYSTEAYRTHLLSFGGGFMAPWIVAVIFFIAQDTLLPFLSAVFASNVTYVSQPNSFFIPFDLLVVKVALLIVCLAGVFVFRYVLNRTTIFVLLVCIFEFFGVFLSQRLFAHYLLLFVPGFSLLCGLLFEEKRMRIAILTFIIVGYTATYLFNYTTYTDRYYGQFARYVSGEISVSEYRESFDPHVRRNYLIGNFIRENSQARDTIFIWGDDAQIYKLSGKVPPVRFTVAYHIMYSPENLNEVKRALEATPPHFIIDLGSYRYPFSLEAYEELVKIENAVIYTLRRK